MSRKLSQLMKRLLADIQPIPDVAVSGISIDSRLVQPGDLYIAIPGTTSDGHDYIPEAIDRGAVAIIASEGNLGPFAAPVVQVGNTRRMASLVAAEFYGHPSRDLTIIGITGTNGKTTTASLLTSILRADGHRTAQMGTLGILAEGYKTSKTLTTENAVNLQRTLRSFVDNKFTHVVMEVSSHAIHQFRVADVHFTIAVFTNLTPEHLDYHGTMDEYFQSKAKLFKMLPLSSTAVINLDDPYGDQLRRICTVPMVFTSRNEKDDLHFATLDSSLQATRGVIQAGHLRYRIDSNFIGSFNQENILSAVGAAHALGIPGIHISEGIRNCTTVPGRMEQFSLPSGGTVIMDYAHTPDAYQKVLSTIRNLMQPNGKMTVVFGCGGNRDATKRPKMGEIAGRIANQCFITPDNPRNEPVESINADIIKGFTQNNYRIFSERGDALRTAIPACGPGDVVAVLGKGREEYQEIRGEKHFYSDLNIIREFTHAD